ncbi:U-box domain-containing protein 25 [Acorus calamus]|uniref:U-box domain-containing protein n=1 Tax=Acorus calamus TaxID=4465 RepID=A0AAV9DIE4_ACOCL|nr:U-box domain-containing protein 25 [Acorus calamus]
MPINERRQVELDRLTPPSPAIHVPHHFRCPISLDLMRDPVIVSTGQTYDRSSIESWLSAGNLTCPVTNLPLSDPSLTPNHTLRRLIQSWSLSLGLPRIPTPKHPSSPSLLSNLLLQLPSSFSILLSLARDSDKNRITLASLGAHRVLLEIVFCADPAQALDSLSLLASLPPGLPEPDCASVATNPNRLTLLSRLLNGDDVDARVDAACLLEMVSSGASDADHRALVGSADGVLEGLVALLLDPSPQQRSLRAATRALFSLCLVKQNRPRAVRAGVAEAVLDRVADIERGDAERALATVELLCRARDGCAAALGRGAAGKLVRAMMKVSDRATEHATGALLSMCVGSEAAQEEAVAAGVVTQLLLVVQSDCTGRAKRKAQALLKMMRHAWPDNDSFANSDDFVPGMVTEFGPF